jgi:RNA polymerase sigma-70 factor (ECF subfamily)
VFSSRGGFYEPMVFRRRRPLIDRDARGLSASDAATSQEPGDASDDPTGRAASGTSAGLRRGSAEAADADAFAAEALSHIDSLYGTAMRLTRRTQDAEDLVQETYLKAFRASDQFERGTNLKAWLFTILHNTYRNMRRHDGRNPVDVSSETVERAVDRAGEDHSPEQILTRATLDADLQAALDELPETFRQAVWLRDVEEFAYAEIAKMIDVPIGTVMSRISRGRRMLYERLAAGRTDVAARVAR